MRPVVGVCLLLACWSLSAAAQDLTINQIQFVGSHNSYKKAMSAPAAQSLRAANPQVAAQLDYAHIPLHEQLALGLRKLELDVFVDAEAARFIVGHIQLIDMNSHCATLRLCLRQIRRWSRAHPTHVPIWISFNAKDQLLPGLPEPQPFTPDAFLQMDRILVEELGDVLIRPADVSARQWPQLAAARGKFLLVLDEQGEKRDWYLQNWRQRPMFANVSPGHPAAAVLIVNDPQAQQAYIQRLVREGYMVRTRADADTLEARAGSDDRRELAFSSGAQAVSTDYYLAENPFGTNYQVTIPGGVRCNPVNAPSDCTVTDTVIDSVIE